MDPSRRQLELLALHSTGKTYAEIGAEFHLSVAMIQLEMDTMRARLGARNLYHAQALALARGYLACDGREGRLFVVELVAA